jgi:UDP-N-acetylmuramate dehydrogenase
MTAAHAAHQENSVIRPAMEKLRAVWGERLQEQAPLARYTAVRVGGPAEVLLTARSAKELAEIAAHLWGMGLIFRVIGGGSNILVSDAGVKGVVVLNRARQIRFTAKGESPQVWAESGANFGVIARQAARRSLAGLEWAAGIPGTIGGAVVGNAGAHGTDMTSSLILAEILHQEYVVAAQAQCEETGKEFQAIEMVKDWTVEELEMVNRSSILKRQPGKAVVLAASLGLSRSTPAAVQAKMEAFSEYRHRTQPPGASIGSMFKNPPGDYAGRLIEAAGLKGALSGDAQISPVHANFFINRGRATAMDIYRLIELARRSVADKFAIWLELEIEPLGIW